MMKKITITLYRWAGQWGPFKINIPCGECGLTHGVIEDVIKTECNNIPIEYEEFEWLSHWWKPLLKGGWHAPIVLVNGRVISQGVALNRGVLVEKIMTEHATYHPIIGNHLFGKDTCPYCQKAKTLLKEKNIEFEYHEVIKNQKDMAEMVARVKPIIGEKTPLTVPQIWLDGKYIGGYTELATYFA